jgi:hypothetical protein
MNKYFAHLEGEELGKAILDRVESYNRWIRSNHFASILQDSYQAYYGLSKEGFSSHNIRRSGKKGELTKFKNNHYRSTLLTVLNIVTQDPPSFKAMAANQNYESSKQVAVADAQLDYYAGKELNEKLKDSCELALYLTEGWISLSWNEQLGERFTEVDSGGVRTGDIEFNVHDPLSVIRDLNTKTGDFNWICLKLWENKWDLIARYPRMEKQILAIQDDNQFNIDQIDLGLTNITSTSTDQSSDFIHVYKMRHCITEAVPEGREVLITSQGDILSDESFPFEDLHCYKISPNRLYNTPLSYSSALDLLSLQQALDALHTSTLTNQSTFGVQNVVITKGSKISIDALRGGMNVIEVPEGSTAPQALNLTQTPAEIFKYMDRIVEDMSMHSGTNDVTRGKVPPNIKSGNALALLAAQAYQFNSGLDANYNTAAERCANAILKLLKHFGSVDRDLFLVGKSQASYTKTYNPQRDLASVARVKVSQVSAVSKTIYGKVELADNMLQQGMIETPEDYLAVRETGNLDRISQTKADSAHAIDAENEALLELELVPVLITDDHQAHIKRHKIVLESPDARRQPQLVAHVLNHIAEHEEVWRQATQRPALMAALGHSPAPMPAAPPAGTGNASPEAPNPQEGPSMPNLPPGAPEQAQEVFEQNVPEVPMPGQEVPV